MPPRLFDLDIPWAWQYAPESTLFDAALGEAIPARLGQVDGYLGSTSAAVIALARTPEDWARWADPWQGLDALVARARAEFCGRILAGPDDLARWRDDRQGMTWALLGLPGCDALVRSGSDLERLPLLFGRGVRVFAPVETPNNVLAGSVGAGEDRGLTDLGRALVRAILELGTSDAPAALDLAGLNAVSMAQVLDECERVHDRGRALLLLFRRGRLDRPGNPAPRCATITPENLRRLRALGGLTGIAINDMTGDPDAPRAEISAVAEVPYEGRPGLEGIGIASGFLRGDSTLPGLSTSAQIVKWLARNFPPQEAAALRSGSATAWLSRLLPARGAQDRPTEASPEQGPWV